MMDNMCDTIQVCYSLKDKLIEKGFKAVYIELPDEKDKDYYVKVWFDFKCNDSGKINQGNDYISGITEEEVLLNADNFIKDHINSTGRWTLILQSK